MQYTIRGIPPEIDQALRQSARSSGKSLNEAVIELLSQGIGVAGVPRKRRDLGDVAGTWESEEPVESALADQDQIDEALWM